MKSASIALLALSILGSANEGSAKERTTKPVVAAPTGSPGDWIRPDDYPATALRLEMEGITVFHLTVDTAGKPSRCDIVESSGFDVLDTATCERLMANARFSAPRNERGQPAESIFRSRVVWQIPDSARASVIEQVGSTLLSIDQTGRIASCRMVVRFPAGDVAAPESPCDGAMKATPPNYGLEMRGRFHEPMAEVEIEMGNVFSPALRERVLAPRSGYEQQGLYVHRFTVTSDGKLGSCAFEQQRGSILLASDFCSEAQEQSFDPPFAAMDKDGIATGWHIIRILLKTGR